MNDDVGIFDAHLLLENEDQVNIYFHFINEINKFTKSDMNVQYSIGDVMKGVIAASAVAGYVCLDPLGIKIGDPEKVKKLIDHFSATVKAMDSQKTIKHFILN